MPRMISLILHYCLHERFCDRIGRPMQLYTHTATPMPKSRNTSHGRLCKIFRVKCLQSLPCEVFHDLGLQTTRDSPAYLSWRLTLKRLFMPPTQPKSVYTVVSVLVVTACAVATSSCISDVPNQWEGQNFDPPLLRHFPTDFNETQNQESYPGYDPTCKIWLMWDDGKGSA